MIRVVIVDDHSVVRQGLKRILGGSGTIELVGEAGSMQELHDLLTKIPPPQVLVMDLSMPGKSGFEALSQIKLDHPKLPILILSVHPEDQYALRSLKAGAAGYLSKECAPEQLVQAIQTVFKGGQYITPSVAGLLTTHLKSGGGDQPVHVSLSNREFQVLLSIGQGVQLTEIGRLFNVSVKTVSTYRTRILEKMGMKTNAELIQYIVEKGLRA
jgi:two-component system invasion response regulator UvrY